MSKISREVPKAIAGFGEKQFRETGASAVEVLRVKESVLRKHFRELKGILYLVAVLSRDRVRVYFFNASGVLTIGENMELTIYDNLRRSSKLLAKFEKPKQLTPEEIRIEATQEMRDALGKAIRRVSRILAMKEPEFPDIFVTRSEKGIEEQSFGIQISDDHELMFEESTVTKSWNDGLLLRAAFILLFEKKLWSSEFASSIGNGLAFSLLKGEVRTAWHKEWKKQSKGSIWEPILNHFVNHSSTYSPKGYPWFTSLMGEIPLDLDFNDWQKSIQVIHDSLFVSLGTEDYHTIDGFCKSLKNPQQLIKRRHILESIHLSPRALCDPTSLGIELSVAMSNKSHDDSWASINYFEGSTAGSLEIVESNENAINSIEYWLNIEDIFPLTGGPLSHGRAVIQLALEKMGIRKSAKTMFEASLELKDRPMLEQKEIAVLERLVLGDLSILSNTLVGSPLIVRNLVEKGALVLLPNFSHIGVNHDFLIKGPYKKMRVLAHLTPETTILNTHDCAYAILSAPTNWKSALIEAAIREDFYLWPIISTKSVRRLLRFEDVFPLGEGSQNWTQLTS
ncbi:MAG: hypothetical protein OEV85_06510 [Candidatus Thorarchaeota archaeon]|nr:hypothetical protein [Candidatus Thorarchaeota archaeon]